MGCILVLFHFLSIINVQFTTCGFLNFLFFNYFIFNYWLTLIQNYHFCLWNYSKTTFTCRLGLKNPKLHFFDISGSSQFIVNINVQINVTHSIFIVNNWNYTIEITQLKLHNWNYQSITIEITKFCELLPYGPLNNNNKPSLSPYTNEG